jgi:hypothetical protein
MEQNLENLTELLTEHRRGGKRGPYPSVVWPAIAGLRKEHTVEEISRATGINSIHIYRKTGRRRRAQFREIKIAPPPTSVALKSVAIELRRGDGAEMRLRLEAKREELSTIVSEFLR